jgi:hypothetical protein
LENPKSGIDLSLEEQADLILREHAKSIDPETGKVRGIGGDNPILFEDHMRQRKRREVTNKTGTVDPSIKRGIYNRQHPQGRKVNSDEQRSKNGASYYR